MVMGKSTNNNPKLTTLSCWSIVEAKKSHLTSKNLVLSMVYYQEIIEI
jgi:hypothetical protein